MTIVKSIWRKSIRRRGVLDGFDRADFENDLVSGAVTQRLNLGLPRDDLVFSTMGFIKHICLKRCESHGWINGRETMLNQ